MKKSLLLVAILSSVVLTSCGPSQPIVEENKVKIVDEGLSDYQIVLPSNKCDLYLATAATELNYFISKATGATFRLVYEDEGQVNKKFPYISLGQTNLAKQNEIVLPEGYAYENSGYYVKSKDNNYYVLDSGKYKSEGILYGVYEILEQLIDLRMYAEDEAYYKESPTLYFKDIDKVYIPTFDARELGYRELIVSRTYSNRMRLINRDVDGRWGAHGHTLCTENYDIIRPSKYYETHPEWYAPNASQLCYTAHGDVDSYKSLVLTVAENMYENYIKRNSDAVYFQFGQNDNHNFCTCDSCRNKSLEYAGVGNSYSGLQVLFVNDVIDKIYELVDAAGDTATKNRNIRFVIFGYQETIEPFNGNKIVPHEKLWFEFTPISTNYAFDFHTTEANIEFYNRLVRWHEIFGEKMLLYTYDVNFKNYLTNFNNFGSYKSHIEDFAANAIKYYYSQGAVGNNVAALTPMRIFVESQLIWNKELNYDDLVYEFMEHYYKDAGDYLKQYYELTRANYDYYFKEVDSSIGGIYGEISTTGVWSKGTLDALKSCLDNAITSIEKYKIENPELYDTLYYRIKRENITVLFLLILNYSGYYSSSTLAAMTEEFDELCARFAIVKTFEGGQGLPF